MSSAIHILIVDDEPEIRSILRQGLEAEGYAVSEAGSKAALIRQLESGPVDLITLDLSLGPEDGLELAREIRARRNVPIIMLTGKSSPNDRVAGLEYGADEYIIKPFHIREVLLRIRNVLSRYELLNTLAAAKALPAQPERFEFEAGILDVPRRALWSTDGTLIELTDMERELLAVFLQHPKRVLSRDQIMQFLKGRDWSPQDRTLDGHVARLRKKVEPPDEDAPRLIKSVRGVGYVFTGDVRRLPADQSLSA
jgi:two-component system OmpR family response regulator